MAAEVQGHDVVAAAQEVVGEEEILAGQAHAPEARREHEKLPRRAAPERVRDRRRRRARGRGGGGPRGSAPCVRRGHESGALRREDNRRARLPGARGVSAGNADERVRARMRGQVVAAQGLERTRRAARRPPLSRTRVAVGLALPADRDLARSGAPARTRGPEDRVALERVERASAPKSRKQTAVETGLPGRPSQSVRAAAPEGDRLAGPHGHAVEEDLEAGAARPLPGSRSRSPAETPPLVTRRSSAAAGLGEETSARLRPRRRPRRCARRRRRARGTAPRASGRSSPGAGRARALRTAGTSSFPVTAIAMRGRRVDRDRVGAGERGERDVAPAARRRPRAQQARPGADALSAAAHVLAGRAADSRRRRGRPRAGLLDRDDRLGARRQRRARHDAHGFAGESGAPGVARGHEAVPFARSRVADGRPRQPDRVAVHRRGVERRPVHVATESSARGRGRGPRQRDALLRPGRAGPARRSRAPRRRVITSTILRGGRVRCARISPCPSTNTSARSCEEKTEVIQRVGEAPLKVCPHCGGKLKKAVSAPRSSSRAAASTSPTTRSAAGKSRRPRRRRARSREAREGEKPEKAEKSEKTEKTEKRQRSPRSVEQEADDPRRQRRKQGPRLDGLPARPQSSLSPFRYSRNGPPRSSRFSANSTVAFRNPSLSPAS